MRPESALRSYQQLQAEFMLSRRRGLIWDDVGFGKTAIAATALQRLFSRGQATRALVMATRAIASSTWADEVAEWQHLSELRPLTRSLVGLPAEERERCIFAERHTRIDTLNYEHLPWLEKQLHARGVPLGEYYDIVICDEVTKLKSPTGVWFRTMARLVHPNSVPRFWGLTGSPASEGYHHIWAPMCLVDYGHRLGVTLQQYLDRYFIAIGDKHLLRNGAKDDIHDALRGVVTALSADDYDVLPPVMYNERKLYLPPKLEDQYVELERDMMLKLAEGDVVAANAGVLCGKTMQFCSGAMYMVDALGQRTDEWGHVHDLKLDALDSLYDELCGRNLLVGVQYRHEVERILKRFERVAVHMTSENVDRVAPEWNAGRVGMLVTHPASCGHGLNLQHGGSDICFYSLPFGLEAFEQLAGRLRRPGQAHSHVTVHALLFADTVDYHAWRAVHTKQSIQQILKAKLAMRQAA